MSFLSSEFVESYRRRPVKWGFPSGPNHIGELVYRRTYRRGTEEWPDTIARVVEGVFGLIESHCLVSGIEHDRVLLQTDAREMFDRIFNFKFLPPGRGLWLMGTDFVKSRGGSGLNNCGFCSSKDIATEGSRPFEFVMDMSMLGVGVGFDTKGAGTTAWRPSDAVGPEHTVADTREGWVESTAVLIRWGLGLCPRPSRINYDEVRPYGSPIRGFGGVASGPGPLKELHERIMSLVESRRGQVVSSRDIVDIMNMIGACVVAGNVRRTALIAFGEPEDEEYLDLKNYDKNPERGAWGWTSNNTVSARVGMDYGPCASRTAINGEPGYKWLENMRAYSRMVDRPDWKDAKALGANPCAEQTLENYELCNLVETFPDNHESLEDYRETLRLAWLYAKAVTLVMTHWGETNEVIRRNRRVGCSVSGVAQFLHRRGSEELVRWLDDGYHYLTQWDRNLSGWWGVPESIKKTSVKPSGTVSLLSGSTPGCHFPTMNTYVRRVRYAVDHPDVEPLREAGYNVEPSIVGYRDYETMSDPVFDHNTVVVEFPVDAGPDAPPTEREVSLRQKVLVAVLLQKYWADNQVSCTASFHPHEGGEIAPLLSEFERSLKSISFLPLLQEKKYPQMPYEAITRDQYEAMTAHLKPVVWPGSDTHAEEEAGCEGGLCIVRTAT